MRTQFGRPQVVALLTTAALALPLFGALAQPASAATDPVTTAPAPAAEAPAPATATGTIGGLVTDTAGDPVAGVQLELANLAKNTNGTATTDANGRYTITTIPGTVVVSIVKGVPRYSTVKEFSAVTSKIVANKRTVLSFKGYFAKTFGTLNGTVTDTADKVLPGVVVTLTGALPADGTAPWSGTSTTNTKGVYSFRPTAGTYTVTITSMPDAYSTVKALLPTSVVVVRDEVTTQDFSNSITRKTGSVSGLIRDNNNAVVEGATVTFKPAAVSGGGKQTTTTNANGFYTFTAPIGSGLVTITKLPMAWVFTGKVASQSVDLTNGASTTADFTDAVKTRGEFTLTGLVTDANDVRVSKAQVKISSWSTGSEIVTTVLTNANGVYSVKMPYSARNGVTLGSVPRGRYLPKSFVGQDFAPTSNLQIIDFARAYAKTAIIDGYYVDDIGLANALKARNAAAAKFDAAATAFTAAKNQADSTGAVSSPEAQAAGNKLIEATNALDKITATYNRVLAANQAMG